MFRSAAAGAPLDSRGLEDRFDPVARLAARIFDAPVGLVTIVEAERIRVLGAAGFAQRELPREPGLCVATVGKDEPHVIERADLDPRTAEHSLVAGAEHVRFYAGVALRAADGARFGTLCVLDRISRRADAEALEALAELAELAIDRFELRAGVLRRAAYGALPQVPSPDADALTGLPGRRAFERELETMYERGAASSELGAVAVISIEGLKAVNARRGREIGDQVLRAVAAALGSAPAEGARLYRIGGTSFGVLLDPVAARAPWTLQASLDAAMQSVRLVGFHEAFACFGLATVEEADSPDGVFRLADWRMYSDRLGRSAP